MGAATETESRFTHYRSAGLWSPLPVDRIVLRHADRDGRATALVDGERSWTHRKLAQTVASAARRLTGLGIGPGHHVLVQLPNRAELVILVLALSRIGATPVLAPVTLRHYELDHIFRAARPFALAVPGRQARFDHTAMARRLMATHPCVRRLLVLDPAPGADGVASTVDLGAVCDRPSDGEANAPTAPPPDTAAAPASPAVCLLSSGSTGPPKVIPRQHEGYGYQLRLTPGLAGVGPGSVYLAVMPVTHGFVLGCPGVLGTIGAGGCVVLGPSPEPDAAFALIERERVTHCTLVPALTERWAQAARNSTRDLSSLQVVQVGGSRPDPRSLDLLRTRLGCRVQQCYGMSEGLLCYTGLDDPDDIVLHTQGSPASAADEIRIVTEDGATVAPGGTGELLTRGPYTVSGYLADPAADASSFTADGFYRTGDLVSRHPSGALVVQGRLRDVINRGGEKVSATEVEHLAAGHPDLIDVAAVAAPDPRFGELVCIFAVARDGTRPSLRDVRLYLADRGLASYKLPERLELLPALPQVGIGKVDKQTLRTHAEQPTKPTEGGALPVTGFVRGTLNRPGSNGDSIQ